MQLIGDSKGTEFQNIWNIFLRIFSPRFVSRDYLCLHVSTLFKNQTHNSCFSSCLVSALEAINSSPVCAICLIWNICRTGCELSLGDFNSDCVIEISNVMICFIDRQRDKQFLIRGFNSLK